MSLLLLIVVNVVLFAYLGPMFTMEYCSYSSMIFENQLCVTGCISPYIIPFGSLAYFWSLVLYCVSLYNINNRFLIYLSSCLTLVSLSCYFYFVLTQVDVVNMEYGYYTIIVSLPLLLFFIVVYKLKIYWLLR